jgi:hypothetical protein
MLRRRLAVPPRARASAPRATRPALGLACALLLTPPLSACSALVDVDPSRLPDLGTADLGGVDGGDLGVDAGDEDLGGADLGRDDGGPLDAGDAGPACPASCDDGVPCTVDRCDVTTGSCVHAPDDGACPGDQRCAPTVGCVPRACTSDASCDDGLYCNGAERCRPGMPGSDPLTGCVAGTPVRCFDDFSCTVDACDEANDRCAFTPDPGACDDRVACTADACAPGAPGADADGCVHRPDDALCPGMCASGTALRAGRCGATGCTLAAPTTCSDGDPCTSDACASGACASAPRDDDRDGFPAARVTSGGMTVACAAGTDCDDTNAAVNPDAMEVCNGRDDDCDGVVDEGCLPTLPDDCRTAQRLTLSGGVATVTGSFGDLGDDWTTSCIQSDAGRGGRDAVYALELTSLSDVEITTDGTAVDTVVGAGTTCGTWLGCDDDIDFVSGSGGAGGNTASRLWVHRVGPPVGSSSVTLYILVDAYGASVTGSYTLTVRVRAAADDSCGGGLGSPGPLDISAGGSVLGFLGIAAAVGGQSGSCQDTSDRFDPEAVFTFVTGDGAQRFFAVSPSFRPDLYVRTGACGGSSASEVGCVQGSGSGGGGTAVLTTSIAARTRGWVFVDNASSSGRYVLDYNP